MSHPLRTYDVLKPVVQSQVEGEVVECDTSGAADARQSSSQVDRGRSEADTAVSLEAYAKHLLETLDAPKSPPNGHVPLPRPAPISPSRIGPRSRVLSPALPVSDLPNSSQTSLTHGNASKSVDRLDVPFVGTLGKGSRPPKGSFVDGDDALIEEGGEEGGCGEAVEILSRHSAKSESTYADTNLELN